MTEFTTKVHSGEEEHRRRRRGLLIWGSVAALGALITAAAFVDAEWASIHPDGGYVTGRHNLQLSDDGGVTWGDYHTQDGALQVTMTGDHEHLVPGLSTVAGDYMVRNASEQYDSTMELTMVDGATSDAELRDALRFTVTVGGDPVASDATYAYLADGIELPNLPAQAKREVEILARVADQGHPANSLIQSQQAELHLRIDGVAVPTST